VTLLAWLLTALVAWSPATSCDDLRAENVSLQAENRALRAVNARGWKWPGAR
jgi:hypothetical protein